MTFASDLAELRASLDKGNERKDDYHLRLIARMLEALSTTPQLYEVGSNKRFSTIQAANAQIALDYQSPGSLTFESRPTIVLYPGVYDLTGTGGITLQQWTGVIAIAKGRSMVMNNDGPCFTCGGNNDVDQVYFYNGQTADTYLIDGNNKSNLFFRSLVSYPNPADNAYPQKVFRAQDSAGLGDAWSVVRFEDCKFDYRDTDGWAIDCRNTATGSASPSGVRDTDLILENVKIECFSIGSTGSGFGGGLRVGACTKTQLLNVMIRSFGTDFRGVQLNNEGVTGATLFAHLCRIYGFTGLIPAIAGRAINSQADTTFYHKDSVLLGSVYAGTVEPIADDHLVLPAPTTVTIAGGVLTITQSSHLVDTEAAAASDDIDTITPVWPGVIIVLRAAVSTRTPVYRDGTGNLRLVADFQETHAQDKIMLMGSADGTGWDQISTADNTA